MPDATELRCDLERVSARLARLWELARGPRGGADRPAWSVAEAAAIRLVAEWAAAAGLHAALDPWGNLWAERPGTGRRRSSGSHVDTVPDGGRYDGALGTVLALEAAHMLQLPELAVLVCAAEEAPRFGAGTLGSRLATGALAPGALDELRDADGTSARAALTRFHDHLSDLPRIPAVPFDRLDAHVEVHVEQRGDLAADGHTLGVVDRVAVPHRHEVVVTGAAGHAGEVPMRKRRDALAAAAELVLELERAANDQRHSATVATVGRLAAEPGAVSVIPGRAVLDLEVRSTDAGRVAAVEAALESAMDDIRLRRGVEIESTMRRGGEPVALDPDLLRSALDAARARDVSAVVTWSGAGHDSQHIAAVGVPTAMLFVPLVGGESHTPHEGVRDADVAVASSVLCDLLTRA